MRKKTIFLLFALIVVVIGFYFVYRMNDPSHTAWMPKCYSNTLFGIMCPGCGTQRALHSLLIGDIQSAFLFNPLLILSIPYFVMVVILEIKSVRRKYPKLHAILIGERAIWILLAVLLIYTLIRNIFGF